VSTKQELHKNLLFNESPFSAEPPNEAVQTPANAITATANAAHDHFPCLNITAMNIENTDDVLIRIAPFKSEVFCRPKVRNKV